MTSPLVIARHLKHVRQLAGVKVPRKRSKLPKQIYPGLIEKDYANAIAEVAGRAARRSLQLLISSLPNLLKSAAESRADAADRIFAGFPVVIENAAGSSREWVDHSGRTGKTLMRWDYGYLDGWVGADGEEVDMYLGPDEDAEWVYIVHQAKTPDFEVYDEDKVMLGFRSADAAKEAYLRQYDDPRFFQGMTIMSLEDFRAALVRGDGGALVHRLDANEGKRAREMVDKAKAQVKADLGVDRLEALGRKYAAQTSSYQKAQIGKQVKAALGVDVVFTDKKLNAKVEHFAAENVSLIKSMQTDVHDDVEKIVTRAIVNGTPHDDVAQEIEERFDVSESHARLIARDQIGKLYGQINASRQQELGVEKFIWRTVGDDRVRDEHDAREEESDPDKGGEPYSYDDPPDGELPGTPIQCRCYAEPVFSSISEDDEDAATTDEGDEE